jgi:hypothetical protein
VRGAVVGDPSAPEEPIRMRLGAEDYDRAVRAHGDRLAVEVRGRLQRRARSIVLHDASALLVVGDDEAPGTRPEI